ncbi:MAG: hypothetical protein IPK03_11970 [Bacteroidetes bacterium]|nr:hypothetical protein [Bacteroidota bacterium]
MAKHKEEIRFVPKAIDQGEPNPLSIYLLLCHWLKSQATERRSSRRWNSKTKMGKASLDMLNKLKSGSKSTIQNWEEEGSASSKFNKDNFDLITWFIIS